MKRTTVHVLFALSACNFSASAIQVAAANEREVESLIEGIDFSDLDRIIENTDFQISLLKAGRDFSEGGEQPDESTQPRETLVRNRGSLLCFSQNLGPQKSRAQLDAYFADIEAGIQRSQVHMESFDEYKDVYPRDACPPLMTDTVTYAEDAVAGYSPGELASLSIHLETCWPDEGSVEENGVPVDVDARFYKARDLARQVQRALLWIQDAKAWCQ